ncbi:MAG: TolC family protein [Kiritimatiellaceae bacterium]|nr:TolC family protein [Kiritimatiellaceae bacterium]
MLPKFHRFPVVAALLLLAGALYADDALTWQDCFSRTVENNIDLGVGRLKLKEAEAALKSQQSVYYPDLTAKAGRSVGGSKPESSDGWNNTDSLSASLNASYTIFDGFGNRARVTKTEAELYAEKANFDQTRSNVEYALRKAFSDQLYAQELLDLVKNIASRRADSVRLVEMRYQGGRENKGSLMLKQAQLADALYSVGETERALELARRRLAGLMKQTKFSDFAVAGELSTNPPPTGVSLDELARQTPSYHSAEANMKAAEQGFIITRSARFPQVTASASLNGSGETEIKNKSWQTGIAVSLPLFTGGKLSQDIIISGLKREQSKLDAENTILTLLNNLQTAINTYRDRYAALSVQKAQLDAADMRATVARAQYQQGLISFQDWDTIENSLITAQRSWLSSRRAADQAEAAWQNAMGISGIR